MNRRLYRSNQHKIIGGVCGGLGEHFDVDPTWIRLGFVVLTILHGLGLLLYIIGWIVIPRRSAEEEAVVVEEQAEAPGAKPGKSGTGYSLLPGFLLIILGLIFLLRESFWWFDFHYVWPVVLIVVGVALVYRSLEQKRKPADEQEGEVVNESR